MTANYTLYGRRGSGSFAVQVALEEIGARYERVWVGQEPADVARYRKLNPTARVPALALPDGTVMFESAAMLIHLAQAHPASRLAPQRGHDQVGAIPAVDGVPVGERLRDGSANLLFGPLFDSRRGRCGRDPPAGTADFIANLGLIGERLDPFVLQSEYSVADVYLYMLASWCPGEKARTPRATAEARGARGAMAARPAVVKVEADHAA